MKTKDHIFGLFLAVMVVAGCMGGQTETADANPPADQAQTTLSQTPTTLAAQTEKAPTTTVQTGQPPQTTLAGDPPAEPTTTVADSGPGGTFIAKTADVPAGSSVDFTYNGDKAILVNIGGTYAAYANKCTHKGCATKFDGSALTCPCHGSQFNPATGDVLKGPAPSPLTSIAVVVSGDSIYAP